MGDNSFRVVEVESGRVAELLTTYNLPLTTL